MPVTSTHQEYGGMTNTWATCRDAVAGSVFIKNAGSRYLPRLGGQTEQQYSDYKSRALWYNATRRTIEGYVGMIFRQDAELIAPPEVDAWDDDITLSGVPLNTFVRELIKEILTVGRVVAMVDVSLDGRPYLTMYPAEKAINWQTRIAGSRQELSMLVLQEQVKASGPDFFMPQNVEQYRVLQFNESGNYEVSIWRKMDKDWAIVDTISPSMRGNPVPFIPALFIGVGGVQSSVERPPLEDLVEVNLSHYRTSADLEHGRHFTALPTPWAAGFPIEGELRIGSGVAWVSQDSNAKAGYLEFSGAGLGSLERALEQKEKLMATLGARLLEPQRAAAESAAALRLRQSGESSVIQALAVHVSTAITKLLRWGADWVGIPSADIEYRLNTDLFDEPLQPQEIAELVKSWQAGAISWSTLYANLQAGEITRPGVTSEQERADIDGELGPM